MGLGTNGLEAIDDAVDELSGELAGIDKNPRVAAVSGEKIYLDRGKGLLKVGDKFQVVHHGQPIRDHENQVIGYEETEVGEIEVVEVHDLMSVARAISKAGQIGRGDLAKPAKH